MRHGLFETIVNFFKGLSEDAVVFTKGALVGIFGSGFILLNTKIGNGDNFYTIITKVCYIGGTGILTGMAVTIGKKIINAGHNWLLRRKNKKKKPDTFSKNGQNKNVA